MPATDNIHMHSSHSHPLPHNKRRPPPPPLEGGPLAQQQRKQQQQQRSLRQKLGARTVWGAAQLLHWRP
jgi:hypothetical protein